MRIAVIGGTGFIGRYVVGQLADAGHEVAVVHRGQNPLPGRAGVTEIRGERDGLRALRNQFRAWSPEVAIDMILSSARQSRATVETFHGIARRVVAISSGDVYRAMAVLHRIEGGELEPVPLFEDSRLRTQAQTYSPEALAKARVAFPWIDEEYDKVQVEQAIRFDPELPATILRLPMVYGPGDPLHRFYPSLKRMQDRRPAILLERSFADFVPCRGYVENVAHGITMAATSERSAGRTYNLAEPGPITEAEWTARFGAVVGWPGRVIALPREQMPAHLTEPYRLEQHLFMDSGRVRSELGYAEPIPVDEALRRTVEWERANPPLQIDPAKYDYAAEDEAIARVMT